ncbi:TraB/GumN family protein [Neolewinella agarilytica]|uniref:TraB/GumN family protein n=1 Tax=Neolewinella agarilytica TaxID=478744 RepID=UPI0023542587|nr:TraB/GumN family protein [Neolewinella agarilytica]
MRISFFSLLFVLLCISCSPKTVTVAKAAEKAPQQTTSTAPAPAHPATSVATAPILSGLAPGVNDTSLLWKISTPGIAQPSYLFGTIHIIPEEDYFLPNRVVAAINDSEELIFEIDPRDMQNPAKLMGLMTKINMRGDTSLEDLLPAEQYAEVEAYFTESGLPFFIFKRMKPLFLSAMVGQDMAAMAEGGGMEGGGMKSYEMELTKLAEAGSKEIGGLETMEFQLSLFDSIPYGAQATMLYQAIQSESAGKAGDAPNEMDELVSLYRRQAIAEMASTISDESAGVARFEELLLTKRNENWVPQIRDNINAANAGGKFYAVGAGHLGGARGVIALLRGAGITVEPVY